MSFREFIEELKRKSNEGDKDFILDINGTRRNMGSVEKNIKTFEAMYEIGYSLIDYSDIFIVNSEDGQVIATDVVPF